MKIMMRYLLAFFVAVLLSASFEGLSLPAQAGDERILSYDSHITVQPDSIVTVRETITVRSAGDEIKHGIYRDFPTVYRDTLWNFSKRGFRVTGVTRDGSPEKYEVQWLPDGWRVLIGDSGVLLAPGEHTYVITYRTNRQLGYFTDHDELYWNVTGNGWQFPIDKASATVELPAGASGKVLSVEGYTGLQGEKGKKFKADVVSGRAMFSTTSPLDKYEGFTIVVTWPKGFVKKPSRKENIRYFLSDNRDSMWGLGGLVVVLAYFFAAWFMVGRDPERRAVVPEYGPPGGLSPAAVRFVSKMGYDDKTFGAALIDLAVKKALKITEKAGDYTLRKIKGEPAALAPEESGLLKDIFEDDDVLGLSSGNYEYISRAADNLKKSLEAADEKTYFNTNRRFFYPGLVLSALAVIASSYHNETLNLFVIPLAFVCYILPLIVLTALNKAVSDRKQLKWSHKRGKGFFLFMRGGLILWYRLLFAVVTTAATALLVWKTSSLFTLFLAGTICINYPFFHLLKAPTKEGGILRDRIEGFETFLAATEEDRLNRMNPPEMTPQLFERFLPYALALDVEQAWAEQFSDILKEAGYEPQWYSGVMWDSANMAGFSSSLGSSLTESISSSSTPPGSSSGSGGSGSSGGGGGGGGGGGW